MDKEGALLDERKLYHDNRNEMISYFSQFNKDTSVSIEATRNWYWLADLLQEQGVDVKLVHAKKTRIIAESTIKTDKIDARVLAHLDRCHFLPQAYLADQQTRSERELLRYHISLVKIQTALKNRIHSILAKHNIQYGGSDLFGTSGRLFLKELALPKIFRFELDGYMHLLDEVALTIKLAKKEIAEHCRAWPEAQLLTSAPGIGPLTGLLLAAEIADVRRFKTFKKICCYGGFAPSTHQSANTEYHGHVIKDANKYIRFAILEAVPHAIRKDQRLRQFYMKIQRTRGHNKARIATGRKLLNAVYCMLKYNIPYRTACYQDMRQVNPCAKLGTVR
jgi:transposase